MFIGGLIPKSDFSQLLNFSELLEHFADHQKEAKLKGDSINFLDFAFIHFFSPDQHQHDEPNEHDNLPFQSFQISIVMLNSDSVPPVEQNVAPKFFNNFPSEPVLPVKGFTSLPFQPPIG